MKISKYIWTIVGAVLLLLAFGCRKHAEKKTTVEEMAPTGQFIIEVKNTVFCIPSPHIITDFIHKQGYEFDESLTSSLHRYSALATSFQKAVNLGIYGTDMGYANAFDHKENTADYFYLIQSLSKDLDIYSTFNKDYVLSLRKSGFQTDSLLNYLSELYRSADLYLSNHNRSEISLLIITGGWVESLYILTRFCSKHKTPELINRIGEHKYPLDRLIKLLAPYYEESDEFTELIDSLADLAYEFDGVEINYVYIKPVTLPDKQVTFVNSEIEILIGEYHLRSISEKITELRKILL